MLVQAQLQATQTQIALQAQMGMAETRPKSGVVVQNASMQVDTRPYKPPHL